MPVNTCCCGEAGECCQCGDCCYSDDSLVEVSWVLKGTPIVEGDLSFAAGMSQAQKDAIVAAANGLRTGTATNLEVVGDCGDWEAVVPVPANVPGDTMLVSVRKDCETGKWTLGVDNQFAVHVFFATAIGGGATGGCCGVVGGTFTAEFTYFDTVDNQAAGTFAAATMTVTVSDNYCCYNGTSCQYTGTEQCTSSASTGECEGI